MVSSYARPFSLLSISLSVIICLLIMLSACSGGRDQQNVASDSARKSETSVERKRNNDQDRGNVNEKETPMKLDVVRWGHPTFKGDSGLQLLGVEKGFFEEQGIEIEWVLNDADTTLLKGLISKEIDVVEIGPWGPLDAIAEGADIKLIGATLPGIPQVLFARSDIKSAKDLEGRSVNILAPGAFFDVLMTLYMRDNAADASKMSKVAVGASAAGFRALIAGKIDATPASPEFAIQIKDNPYYHILTKFSEDLPNFLRLTLTTRGDLIRDNPDLVQRFMFARSKSLRYAIENPEEVKAIGARYLNLPANDQGISDAVNVIIDERLAQPDLAISPERMQYILDARLIMDPTKTALTIEQVHDSRFQEQVAKELGAWVWR